MDSTRCSYPFSSAQAYQAWGELRCFVCSRTWPLPRQKRRWRSV